MCPMHFRQSRLVLWLAITEPHLDKIPDHRVVCTEAKSTACIALHFGIQNAGQGPKISRYSVQQDMKILEMWELSLNSMDKRLQPN